MRYLITGGAGFIGSNLIIKLIEHGHQVLNVDSLTYAANLENLDSIRDKLNYEFENIDITEKENIASCVNSYEPEIIIHLAAESHVDRSIQGPGNFISTNIIGTYNLLEAFRDYYSLQNKTTKNLKFLHVSTDEVFGDLQEGCPKFNENNPYKPNSPYSASKASSDHLVRSWNITYKIPTLITNCSNNFGPYQHSEKLIPNIVKKAISGNSIPIYGDGSQIRDWLYVEDHVNALILVSSKGKEGETYNIGGNNEIRNIDLANLVCLTLDELVTEKPNNISSFTDLITFVEDRPGHDFRYAIDTTKINSELGWYPKEDFSSALRKTLEWYLKIQ